MTVPGSPRQAHKCRNILTFSPETRPLAECEIPNVTPMRFWLLSRPHGLI